MLTRLTKKLIKELSYSGPISQWEREYIPYYPKEQKERYIKDLREKRRHIEAMEERSLSIISSL